MKTDSKVAVLGTGIMGFQFARRLCEAAFSVSVWNRTDAKAHPLQAYGARLALSPNQAVADADVIIAMLADYSAARQVYFEQNALASLKPGSLFIEMATMPPVEVIDLSNAINSHGGHFIDAPVSGGEASARAGTLSIMAGGTQEDLAIAGPILAPLGRITHVGPVGSGAVAKLCNQILVGNTVLAVAEALNLARQLGADPFAVHSALQGGFADSVILREHGQRMLDKNFTPGGPAKYLQQILLTVEDIATKKNIPLPLARVTRKLYEVMIENGNGSKDLSAIINEL